MNSIQYILLSKGSRVFVFGIISIMTPIYMALLGYSAFIVGLSLAVMIGGNIFSNTILLWLEKYIGRKKSLLIFSFFIFVSGILLYSTSNLLIILFALFLSNGSTTGTEAGPFQSVETGILPRLIPINQRNRAFALYNFIGYVASSVGAFAASVPAYFENSLLVFHYIYLLYGLVGILLLTMYILMGNIESSRPQIRKSIFFDLSQEARNDIKKLSVLFAVDAFGGGFVSQSLLSYWFFYVYQVSLKDLGLIFFIANIITALSVIGASYIADRLGNLRTMVLTHIISNVFLTMIPLVGNLVSSLILLFLRQSTSQMDVPTRQAFMMNLFHDQERVTANAVTNTSRIISNIFGSPISGELLSIGLVSVPLLIAGLTKITYDILIFSTYRKGSR